MSFFLKLHKIHWVNFMLNIKDDSRKVKKGDTFIALKKMNDGHNYVKEAILNGAERVIVEHGLYDVDTIIVKDTHQYLVEYLYNNYYDKISHLKLIGMTGTNGKTTTCFLLYQALNKANIKTAYIGTIGFYLDKKIKDLNNTTPDILELYELLLECVSNDIEYVVMEVSSQALDMHRLDGIEFEFGIFSNITQDHLDYHKSMENYIQAKRKLFEHVKNKTFVNIDDDYSNYFMKDNTITYGINKSKYQLSDYSINLDGSMFKVNEKCYKTRLIGKHNLYNVLVVIAVLSELNIENIDNIVKGLISPKGRMDVVKKDDNLIIVDYAHTPDAVSKIISSVKELNPNNIITIIGCGGNRDKTKRPIMSKIAIDNSDYVILTSDNPRYEDPNDIINDMLQNIDKSNYEIEINREKSIIKGIQLLSKNDILLVLGKGHENYQIINGVKYEFDDKKIVLDNI